MKRTALLVSLVLCLIAPRDRVAGSKVDEYDEARKQAIERSDIFTGGPLQLRATIRLHGFKALVGSYEYLSLSKDVLAIRIRYPDYNSVLISQNGDVYFTSSQRIEPLPALHVRELMSGAQRIFLNPPIEQMSASQENGVDTKCYRTFPVQVGHNYFYEACFDAQTGSLTTSTWQFNNETQRFQYLGFIHDGSKLYPSIMRFYKNGTMMSEVEVDSLSHLPPDTKSGVFDPPPGAVKREKCAKFEPANPEYSRQYYLLRSDSKAEGQDVVVAGTLDEKGRVDNILIQQPGTEPANNLALAAVREIHARPARCDRHALPSSFRLHIWFYPGSHMDSFESFR